MQHIKLYVTHWYISYSKVIKLKKQIWGILWWHIMIEIDSMMYGFMCKNPNIALYSGQIVKNAYIENISLENRKDSNRWLEYEIYSIPVSDEQYLKLIKIIEQSKIHIPFDYVFFWYRCYWFVLYILSLLNIIPIHQNFLHILIWFIPKIWELYIKYRTKRHNGYYTLYKWDKDSYFL